MSCLNNDSPPRMSASPSKRLGYIKPHAQPFSISAQKRSSVMSLGQIDHLQHRFAKGARLTGRDRPSRDTKTVPRTGSRGSGLLSSLKVSEEGNKEGMDEEEMEEREEKEETETDDDYYYNPASVPLPPSPKFNAYVRSVSQEIDPLRLRKSLKAEVTDLLCLLDCYGNVDGTAAATMHRPSASQVIDAVRTCINSARTYSTSIPTYHCISTTFSIFREDAMEVLGQLRQVEGRNTSHVLTVSEQSVIHSWATSLIEYLNNDRTMSTKSMDWLHSSLWVGYETDQCYSFLAFYDTSHTTLTDPAKDKNLYLQDLSTGTRLCRVFNSVVRRSRKPFGLITRFHENTDIRYRVLENLRFWKAAMGYRFSIDLPDFDGNAIHDLTQVGKTQLEQAVKRFCQAAIKDMNHTLREEVELREDVVAMNSVERLAIGDSDMI